MRWALGHGAAVRFVALAAGIQFTMDILKVLPERPVFRDYVARLSERPAFKRYQERDQAMAMATPLPMMPMARPRRRMNQRLTVCSETSVSDP